MQTHCPHTLSEMFTSPIAVSWGSAAQSWNKQKTLHVGAMVSLVDTPRSSFVQRSTHSVHLFALGEFGRSHIHTHTAFFEMHETDLSCRLGKLQKSKEPSLKSSTFTRIRDMLVNCSERSKSQSKVTRCLLSCSSCAATITHCPFTIRKRVSGLNETAANPPCSRSALCNLS